MLNPDSPQDPRVGSSRLETNTNLATAHGECRKIQTSTDMTKHLKTDY